MKRRDEVLVGVLMTVAILVAIMGSIWLTRGSFRQGYPLYAVFPWGAGLKQGQPVLLAGVAVGYVDDVELRREGTLLVSLRVHDDHEIPLGTTARVQAFGIFGDMVIALLPAGPHPDSFQPGDTIPAGAPEPTVADLITRADSVARSVQAITTSMEASLVQAGAIAELHRTIANTNRFITQLNTLAAEQSRQFGTAMTSLNRTLAAVDSAAVDSTVRNAQSVTQNLAQLTADFETTRSRLDSVLAKVEGGSGSMALLLNDPGLYNDARMLLTRLDSLTADFKANPRRYINLSIF
jgi:phospholipid/cholesterol/gamma-HCH transport system substrate-binding protein